MRIVVPYVQPHPLAVAAVDRLVPTAERHDVSARQDSYWELLNQLWGEGQSFLVIEQDVEPTEKALRQAKSCPCAWGVVIAYGPSRIEFDGSLSFTWFRASLIETEPDLFTGWRGATDHHAKSWRSIDTHIVSALRERGHKPHVHRPPVPHHHVYQGQCACLGDHPLYPVDREGRYEWSG